MAEKVKVTLLKPLNGAKVGSNAEYSQADAKMLESKGAVKMQGAPKNKMADAPANKSDLGEMLKKELIATAEAEGVEYETDDNKADLIRKIEKARG